MDELTIYLKAGYYHKLKLEQILNKKIIITKEHIDNIHTWNCQYIDFDIINMFEKYGYVFTYDDYILLVKKGSHMFKFIQENIKTDKLCKFAVQQSGYALQYVPDDKKTEEICKIAVQQDGYTLQYIPDDKKTDEICEIAVLKTGLALQYVPENKKTEEICRIAVKYNNYIFHFVPHNKQYLFIKNENNNI